MIIKVCGMRDAQNIKEIENLGIDMMGFICWENSSRNISSIPTYLPSCQRVGVFVNPTLDHVLTMTDALGLNRIQLHGTESPCFCRKVGTATGLPVMKAISVHNHHDIGVCRQYADEPSVDLFLFDTACQGSGGSGKHFDWAVLKDYDGAKPFIIAGGIGPDDTSLIKKFHHPGMIGVDLNSRFELSPALKDTVLLSKFISRL